MGTTSSLVRVKKEMFRIVLYQSLIILGFTLLIFLLKGMQNSLSALAGAFAYWLPSSLFIWRMSAQASAHVGMRFLALFVFGECIKLLLCGVLFIFFIKCLHLEIGYSIVGLAGAVIAFWVASAFLTFKSGASS